jgi:hypothetical protein
VDWGYYTKTVWGTGVSIRGPCGGLCGGPELYSRTVRRTGFIKRGLSGGLCGGLGLLNED